MTTPCEREGDPEKSQLTWKPTITFVGPMALHDMPCPICRLNKAVFRCNDGYFEPCWTCQRHGFRTDRGEGISKGFREGFFMSLLLSLPMLIAAFILGRVARG